MAFENSRAFTIESKKIINEKQLEGICNIEIPKEKPLKKVVSVHALSKVESSDKVGETVNFMGKTSYQVVYLCEDNTLAKVTAETEWQNSLSMLNEEEYFLSSKVLESTVTDFSLSYVQISSIINVELSAVVVNTINTLSNLTDDYVVKNKNVEYNKLVCTVRDSLTEVCEQQVNADEILFNNAAVKVNNVYAGIDNATIEGFIEVVSNVLIDNKIEKVYKTIEFKQEVNASGVVPENILDVDVTLSKLVVALNHNETDNVTNFIYTVECAIQGVVYKLEQAEVLEDTFSTKKIITVDSECLLNETYRGYNTFEQKESFNVELDRNVSEILYVSELNAKVVNVEIEGDKAKITGVINASVACLDENSEHVTLKTSVPFSQEVENYHQSNKVAVSINENACRVKSDKEALLDVTLNYTVKMVDDDYVSFISMIEEVEDRNAREESINVYVTTENEDLFSVAKNLCVKIEDILNQNQIDEEGLKGGERLVVYTPLNIDF